MNSPEDKTIDMEIKKALGGKPKEFDFERFKEKYPEQIREYQLQARARNKHTPGSNSALRFIGKLAAAAMLLTAVGLFLLDTDTPEKTADTTVSPHPASMISLVELNRVYREGGLDAVDNQYKQAHVKLGPRTSQATWITMSKESL